MQHIASAFKTQIEIYIIESSFIRQHLPGLVFELEIEGGVLESLQEPTL